MLYLQFHKTIQSLTCRKMESWVAANLAREESIVTIKAPYSVAYSTCHAITRTISHMSLRRTHEPQTHAAQKRCCLKRSGRRNESSIYICIYTTYMYISQMHFVEGFAAGPNVDRRGRRYRPLSIHAACFFFFLSASHR